MSGDPKSNYSENSHIESKVGDQRSRKKGFLQRIKKLKNIFISKKVNHKLKKTLSPSTLDVLKSTFVYVVENQLIHRVPFLEQATDKDIQEWICTQCKTKYHMISNPTEVSQTNAILKCPVNDKCVQVQMELESYSEKTQAVDIASEKTDGVSLDLVLSVEQIANHSAVTSVPSTSCSFTHGEMTSRGSKSASALTIPVVKEEEYFRTSRDELMVVVHTCVEVKECTSHHISLVCCLAQLHKNLQYHRRQMTIKQTIPAQLPEADKIENVAGISVVEDQGQPLSMTLEVKALNKVEVLPKIIKEHESILHAMSHSSGSTLDFEQSLRRVMVNPIAILNVPRINRSSCAFESTGDPKQVYINPGLDMRADACCFHISTSLFSKKHEYNISDIESFAYSSTMGANHHLFETELAAFSQAESKIRSKHVHNVHKGLQSVSLNEIPRGMFSKIPLHQHCPLVTGVDLSRENYISLSTGLLVPREVASKHSSSASGNVRHHSHVNKRCEGASHGFSQSLPTRDVLDSSFPSGFASCSPAMFGKNSVDSQVTFSSKVKLIPAEVILRNLESDCELSSKPSQPHTLKFIKVTILKKSAKKIKETH